MNVSVLSSIPRQTHLVVGGTIFLSLRAKPNSSNRSFRIWKDGPAWLTVAQ